MPRCRGGNVASSSAGAVISVPTREVFAGLVVVVLRRSGGVRVVAERVATRAGGEARDHRRAFGVVHADVPLLLARTVDRADDAVVRLVLARVRVVTAEDLQTAGQRERRPGGSDRAHQKLP